MGCLSQSLKETGVTIPSPVTHARKSVPDDGLRHDGDSKRGLRNVVETTGRLPPPPQPRIVDRSLKMDPGPTARSPRPIPRRLLEFPRDAKSSGPTGRRSPPTPPVADTGQEPPTRRIWPRYLHIFVQTRFSQTGPYDRDDLFGLPSQEGLRSHSGLSHRCRPAGWQSPADAPSGAGQRHGRCPSADRHQTRQRLARSPQQPVFAVPTSTPPEATQGLPKPNCVKHS